MKAPKLIRTHAPVRIDFAGGWTDVALFAQESKGYVVNAAIDIYSYLGFVIILAEIRNKPL